MKNESCKKRILFVYWDYKTVEHSSNASIALALMEEYDIVAHAGLDDTAIDLVQQALSDQQFDAMITHVPFESHRPDEVLHGFRFDVIPSMFYSLLYGKSLSIIAKIKKLRDMPIIAYTGADDTTSLMSVFMESGGIDCIIPKCNFSEDMQKIREALGELLQKYKTIPRVIEPPVINIQNGFTTTTATVLLNNGFGLSSISRIVTECNKYAGKVQFRQVNAENTGFLDGKNILDPHWFNMAEGVKVIITVEGEDEHAQKLARRLYSALSSRYAFVINFDRF